MIRENPEIAKIACQNPDRATQSIRATTVCNRSPADAVSSESKKLACMTHIGVVGNVTTKEDWRKSADMIPPIMAHDNPATAPCAI